MTVRICTIHSSGEPDRPKTSATKPALGDSGLPARCGEAKQDTVSRNAIQQSQTAPSALGARRAWLWIGLLLCCVALPADAKRLVQVRVGNHPTFTRLVFEMDEPAGYRVERRSADDGGELLSVTLDAGSRDREIQSKSVGIESVHVEAGAAESVAKIRLRKAHLPMKELILSNPPRIVLDFDLSSLLAQKPAPGPVSPRTAAKAGSVPATTASKPASPVTHPELAQSARAVEPAPRPARQPEAKPATPKPVAVEQPAPPKATSPVVAEQPAPPKAASSVVAESAPYPGALASVEDEASVRPKTPAEADAERRAALRAKLPGAHKRPEPEPAAEPGSRAIGSKPAAPAGELAAGLSESPIRPESSAPTPKRRPSPPPAPAEGLARTRSEPDSDVDAVKLAAIAVGALVLVALGVWLARRRSIPADLDIAAIAEAGEPGVDTGRERPERRSMDEGLPAERTAMPEPGADEPAPRVMEEDTAAYSLSEVAGNAAETPAEPYDEEPEGEKAMDLELNNDLPTQHDEFSAPPPAAAPADSQVTQLVRELASRIASLETRLDESNDARERLERQVAAQSEELRVQRAAIARTQRALRSLNRSEEEQATEPALRDPSKPVGPPA